AVCDSKIEGTCTQAYSNDYIKYRTGVTQRVSGGSCTAPDTCTSCNDGFYGDGPYCSSGKCSSVSDNICEYCYGEVKPKKYWRAYTSAPNAKATCEQACSWRSDSTRCYPGTCSDETTANCVCSEGFSGYQCDTMTEEASIVYNEATLTRAVGQADVTLLNPPDPNSRAPQDTVWTNQGEWDKVQAKWDAKYDVVVPAPGGDHYITDFKHGIILAKTKFIHKRSILIFSVQADLGGIGYYVDRETNTNKQWSLTGTTVKREFTYHFDMVKPYHCIACEELFNVPESTDQIEIAISWGTGWVDDLSGIDYFEYDVFLLGHDTMELGETLGTKVLGPVPVTGASSDTFSIPSGTPGAYSIHLVAYDKAGNFMVARKIFLFDDQSVVDKVGPLPYSPTATEITNYVWVTEDTNTVRVQWTDRFENTRHYNGRWLNAVKPSTSITDSQYDDITGRRQITEVNNVRAIVDFKIEYSIYDASGLKSFRPFTTVSDIQDQYEDLTISWVDGDKLDTTLSATDFIGASNNDSITVYKDSTPPVIENLWLTRGDRLNISVHKIEDFAEMTIEWEVYDYHSGIDTIKWRLYDNFTGMDILHGIEDISAQGNADDLSTCQSTYGGYPRGANCYCTPFWGCHHQHYQVKPAVKGTALNPIGLVPSLSSGIHDSDYFIEVSATNRAQLTTILRKKITVDISPPHTGVVHDGIRGTPEVDYQQSTSLKAHWEGFFDRESGVLFYQYGFDTSCIDKAVFQLDSGNPTLHETYNTDATYSAPGEGQYFITVVAYNRALEPSDTVCSDGVTVTTAVPKVKEVTIDPSRIRGGLVSDQNQTLFYVVGDDRVRRLIREPTPDCFTVLNYRSKATPLVDVDMLPIARADDGSIIDVNGTLYCSNTSSAPQLGPTLSRSSRLHMSWKPVLAAGGIHDYEVGLATISGSPAPDILAFRSTKQHAHIDIHHADIPDGTMFYIIIKAISKANVEGIRSIGPCFMDTTPPDFIGPISITYSGGYIHATWAADAFVDSEDGFDLHMQFAIGHDPGSTDVHDYQDLQSVGPCSSTNPSTCTAIMVEDTDWFLHGHHTYYMTIKAENTAGLSTYGVSESYIHDVQLPAKGKVFDVDPQDIEDIDFQVSTTELSARWMGFAHPHLTVTYRFSIGTTSGGTDIMSEVDIGGITSYTETGLSLSSFVMYYVTIKAVTSVGSVSVTSDGVMVVEEGYALQGITVYDGDNCTMEDIDYQTSTNSLKAYWTVPSIMQMYTPDVHFAIEEKHPSTPLWSIVRDYEHISSHNFARVNDLFLKPGYKYRFSIKFCALQYCYTPVTSNGVLVLANPPTSGPITITHLNTTQGAGGIEQIVVEMMRFYDPDIQDSIMKYSVIDRYEWAITDQSTLGRTHTNWTTVTNIALSQGDTYQSFTIDLTGLFDFSKCRSFAVRGFNKVKLVSQVSAQIKNCAAFDPLLIIPNDVIDAVGTQTSTDGLGNPIFLEENALWPLSDRDYTPYYNYISAVWPRLRYNDYKVAVIHYKTLDVTTYYKPLATLNLNDPCSHPDAIACTFTDKEYHNFKFEKGILKHGERYIVCLHGNRTEIPHEKWTQILPDLNTCSDGVVVDLTPPVAGDVWITNIPGTKYQTSTSDMYINWDSFRDVEEFNTLAHSSGVQDYTFGLGTSSGGNDMVAFYSVGVVNHVALHNLNLQSGHIYYATIIAKDYANRTTTKISDPVVVDTTPPIKQDVAITIPQRHIVSKSEIEACWTNLFRDIESGIDSYEWSIGSEPGYDDIMTFTKVTDDCASNNINNPLNLQEGHAYYISVKAYNNAGLMSLATSWAYVVDTSPPIAGHVYDGMSSNLEGRKDVDFQTDMSYISAFWEGFHDSHSAIQEYYVSIGTCPGCMNSLDNQAVGMVTELNLTEVHFGAGLTYYTTVKACNTADMCTSVTSDGVIMDISPPTMGVVQDGTTSNDIEYQSVQTYIGAKWYGFVDPQSGMYKYQWRVGTTPGGDDLMAPVDIHLTQVTAKPNLNISLPEGNRIYITVRGFNKAGLYTDATSDGFLIDTSTPAITSGPTFSSLFSATGDAQFFRNTIKVEWTVRDDQSYIERQYLSIKSHRGGEFNLASTSVNGISRDFVLSDLNLNDGVTYYVQLLSCNGAQICSTATSSGLLMDSTPPSRGMFAIHTDHSVNHELLRHVDGWMTWSKFAVHLAWLGFADLHSEIDYYKIYVGSSFMATDLNKEPGIGEKVIHLPVGVDKYDEGKVQTATVETQKISSISDVYITIYAVNKVGLRSELIHSQFKRINGGTLSLTRRCVALTCEGRCVCAAQDKLCAIDSNVGACNDVTVGNPNYLLTVKDVQGGDTDMAYTASNTVLQGAWSVVLKQGDPPLWYEWSVGLSSEALPEGVFDESQEKLWYDAGNNLNMIFTEKPGVTLMDTLEYACFVRVWYSFTDYAIFKSGGVQVTTQPPLSSVILGSAVTERMFGKTIKDEDYMKYGFPFTVSWENKFRDANSVISSFRVYLSLHDLEYQNASDVVEAQWHGFTDTESGIVSYYWCVGLTTQLTECGVRSWEKVGLHTFVSRNLSSPLDQATMLYNKVYAEDRVGYRSPVAVSDGVRVDTTAPIHQYLLHMGENLLQNPSFESVINYVSAQSINTTQICNLTSDFHPDFWMLTENSCGTVVDSTTNLALDGRKFLFIRDGLVQYLSGLMVGELYRLEFYTSHTLMSSSLIANKEGFVNFGGDRDVFLIYNKAYRKDGHGSSSRPTVSWHKHTFYFEPRESEVNLTIGSVDDRTGIFIDHVTFEHVDRYSEGGTQVQGFRSVGTSLFAYNSTVVLIHNTYVYITVIARNTVGLQSVIYSDPLLVDLTAPDIKGVYDGRITGEDEFARTDNEISVNWEVEDPESGIDYCEWAIGNQTNGIELQVFTKVPSGSFFAYRDLDYSLLRGQVIFTTVRCRNRGGLFTSMSSNGVRITDVSPSIEHVVVTPLPQSITEYRPQDNYQSNTTDIRIKWSGFTDDIGIDLYQISLSGSDIRRTEKTNFPIGQDVKYVNVLNLNLVPERKEISLKAINPLGLQSDSILTNLTVFVDKPELSTSQKLAVLWNTPNKEFTVSWDGIFSSPHSLYYEVSAGKVKGGGEIVQWLETNETSVTFGLPPAINNWANLDVFIFVRAIAAGGLFEDVHGEIKLPGS
ncbi:hypothetical protein FSP39_000383, partial [Pinctada imbricata]